MIVKDSGNFDIYILQFQSTMLHDSDTRPHGKGVSIIFFSSFSSR